MIWQRWARWVRRRRWSSLRRLLPPLSLLPSLGVLAVALCGAAIGAALAPAVTTAVGPLQTEVRVRPSLDPGVHLLLPPAGVVTFDTHWAPLAVEASVSEVDLAGARAMLASPRGLDALERSAPDDLRRATLLAAALTVGYAFAGAVILSLLVYRTRWRRSVEVVATLTAVLVTLATTTAATFDADRLAQPRFTGLLSQAPYVAGQASSLMRRLESYRAGLADIVQGVTTLYGMSGQLPVLPGGTSADVVTVLHVSDIHLNPLGFDLIDRMVKQFKVDMVVDSGDITTWGTDIESSTVSRIGQVPVPYVFVRGNHDSARTEAAVGSNRNAVVLDGRVAIVKGLVIAGIGDPRFLPDGSVVDALPTDSAAAGASGAAVGASPAATQTPSPAATLAGQLDSPDPEVRAGARLAEVVRSWNTQHPDNPVDIAALHEPYGVPPLLGSVPLVLAGHFHKRSVALDDSGTRVMVEGSTGGAGVSADFKAVADGDPLPLSVTLIYIAASGPRRGEVVAYDEVTVGGFGLASVTLQRTVVREGTAPVPHAGLTPSDSSSATPSATPSATQVPDGAVP